jgi:4-hydroxy-4-methyl-2-oxoglutarate aldolase
MLHAAIYRAPPGSIIVVQGGDMSYALAGGNVCAIAQEHGIAGFILDGALRDLAEVRSRCFPVFARGIIPVAGRKEVIGSLNATVSCGGVLVSPQDIIVADEEGVVVVPCALHDTVLQAATARATEESAQTLESWQAKHRRRIDELLRSKGFVE